MDCSEYLEHASEFLDGRIEGPLALELEAHLSECPSCSRHRTTLEKGLQIFRSLSKVEVPADFRPRLAHRIYHLEDGSCIARESLGSGATTASVLAIAVLLAVVAWTPRAGAPEASLEFPPVIVAGPPAQSFTPGARTPTFFRGASFFATVNFQEGVWGDTHQVLFEYSSLSERRREQGLSLVGLQ